MGTKAKCKQCGNDYEFRDIRDARGTGVTPEERRYKNGFCSAECSFANTGRTVRERQPRISGFYMTHDGRIIS
jgi:hypothetical protein